MLETKSTTVNLEKTNAVLATPENSPLPSYAADDQNGIPDITAAFSNLDLRSFGKPTADQCIAHLKLLEAFHQLREDVALTDGLFGLQDAFVPSTENERQGAELLTKIREKRWAVYVAKAAKRFQSWWEMVIEPSAQRLQQKDIPTMFEQAPEAGIALLIDRDHMPPLDVIMVWHAYQLNPRVFFEDCLRYGKMKFWRAGLPWPVIDSCINNETFDFTPSNEAVKYFENRTGFSWDSRLDPSEAQVKCPNCNKLHTVPWTKWDSKSSWQMETYPISLKGEHEATGFADKSFSFKSPCGAWIDHELLKTQQFRKDFEALRFNDVPMPGTLLDIKGLTGAISKRDSIKRHQPLFPNRLILGADDNPSKLYTMLEATTAVNPHSHHGTMSDVRVEIENALRDRAYVKKANHTFVGALQPQEKVSVRRMMSCYWDNSTPFSLDLVGAVIRQGSFIEKMHSIDWIHSPTVTSTMNRLLEKYDRYFTLLAAHPNNTAVPTLDVDLAWHTHQLSPPTYYAHSVFKTRKLIDHDDKIDEIALSTAFEWTSKTYQKMFNELYSECTCWYCEAVRESHSSPLSRIFSANNKSIETQLAALHPASDPHSTPHISAHSAIRAETDENRAVREGLMRVRLEREYKKAAQRARKKGREVPRRDEYMYASAYGYPIAMPYYAPYMGDPCTGGLYAAEPGCASFATGAAGNCCKGACGGGVAAGACGGGGSAGCAGGAAGGCGGGGGGCGGGGGGGGCGGGGGG